MVVWNERNPETPFGKVYGEKSADEYKQETKDWSTIRFDDKWISQKDMSKLK